MLTFTSLKMLLCWQQAGSGGSGIAQMGTTGFAGRKLVKVDPALLVGVKLALLGASW